MPEDALKAKILVVDDEVIIGADLKNRVEALGYVALGPASYGQLAVRTAEDLRPDLVLMDIILGEGMDGIEAASIIRERFGIPVVFITAYADDERLARAKLTQPFGYIIKPFRDRELKITIEMALYSAKMDAERKQMENALRESEERFRTVVSSADHGIIYQAQNGEILTWNKMAERIFGLRAEQVIGQNAVGVDWETYREDGSKFIGAEHPSIRTLATGEACRDEIMKVVRADGGHSWISINTTPVFKDGGSLPDAVAITFSDITDQRRLEEELKDSLVFLQESQKVARLGGWKANPETDYLAWTDGVYDIIEAPLTYRPRFSEGGVFYLPEYTPVLRKKIKTCLESGESFITECQLVTSSGKILWVEVRGLSSVRDGNQAYMIGTIQDVSERKQAENALKESEARFRTFVEKAHVGIYVTDANGDCTYVNEQWRRMSRLTFEEAMGKGWVNGLHEDDRETIGEKWYHSVQSGGDWGFEYRFKGPDGNPVWVYGNALAIRDGEGRITGCIGTNFDISERKRLEEALRNQRDSQTKLFESVPFILMLVDEGGRVEQISRAAVKFSGRPREELLGLLGGEVFGCLNSFNEPGCGRNPECADCPVRTRVTHTMQTGESVHDQEGKLTVLKHGEAITLHLLISTARLCIEKVNKVLVTIADVTERKRAEDALLESEDKFRKAFLTSPDAVNINRLEDGLYVDINEGFTRLTGFTREDVLGKTSLETNIWNDLADRRKLVEGLREKGWYENLEAKFRRKDGSLTTALMSARVITLKGVPHILSITRDISERKQLEDQLRQALKMEAVGTLAGGIAHDFNNLTQAVIGYAQLLLLEKDEKSEEYRDLTAIYKAGERSAQLVRQLMTFSRKVEGDRRPINLNHVVAETESLLDRTIPKMIDKQLGLGDSLWPIDADPIQMEQVLLNLGSNAADAMPEGGRLVIRTSNVTLDEAFCRTRPESKPGRYVRLTVSDTGHGMDRDTLQKIFDPFFTTKEQGKGTGLGLASVYGIVKGHGGQIYCESEPGRGATFMIYLPAISPAEDGPGEGKARQLPKGQGETILVVDDETAILELTGQLLERFGYRVLLAESGEAGLEVFRGRKGGIDLVILDLNMPGMGGLKCLEEMLKIDPGARVAIASGYSAAARVKTLLEQGAAGFIGKPFELEGLLAKVRAIIDEWE